MKKLKIITLVTLLCFICTIPAIAAGNWDSITKHYNIKVFINDKDHELEFPPDMGKPFIAKDRTFVPYRIMCEALGANVDWDGDARKVTATGNGNTVELFIGNPNYKVNGTQKTMDVEPFILSAESRTYIPARYITEGLNYTIDFAQGGRVMYIVSFTKGQGEAERKAVLDELVKLEPTALGAPKYVGMISPPDDNSGYQVKGYEATLPLTLADGATIKNIVRDTSSKWPQLLLTADKPANGSFAPTLYFGEKRLNGVLDVTTNSCWKRVGNEYVATYWLTTVGDNKLKFDASQSEKIGVRISDDGIYWIPNPLR